MNQTAVLIILAYLGIILLHGLIKTPGRPATPVIRKSVHLITGLALFGLTYCLDSRTLLALIFAGLAFSVVTYMAGILKFIHGTSGSSLGTLFYPAGILSSFLMLYNMPPDYFRIVLLILSVSDTVANLGGSVKKGNFRFTVLKEEKSLLGAAGFGLSAFIIHLILLPQPDCESLLYITLSVIGAVNFELISCRGSDNLSIPAGCSLFFFFTGGACSGPETVIITVIFSAAGSILLYRKNILTRYGSIAAYFLAVYLFAVLGIIWALPVITFFITSVLFTIINGRVNGKSGDTNRRNIWQVLANILSAAVSSALYLATGNDLFIYFFISLVAAVTADTWASELGPVFTKRCFSLAHRRMETSGISGGISLPGTAAALAGSLIITVLSCFLFFGSIAPPLAAAITLAGFLSVFADSLLSAFFEPLLLKMNFFRRNNGPDALAPNDAVNFLGSLTAPFFFLMLRLIF